MALETNKQYDAIVGTIMQNIIAEMNLTDNKIVLWDFRPESASDRLYYYAACLVSDLYNKEIYLQMSLRDYWKFKKANKRRKNLHWITRNCHWLAPEHRTSVYIIVDFVREYYGVDEEIFDKINKEYYEVQE